jgi:cell division protein FtsL
MNAVPVVEWAIAAFVFMGALSMIAQAITTYRTFQLVRQIKDSIEPLLPKTRETLDQAILTLTDSRKRIGDIAEQATTILGQAQVQMVRVEEVVLDAATRARNQLARTELVVEDTVSRVQETVSAVQGTVLRPIREVNGLAAGVKAAVSHLIRPKNQHVDRVAQDEEMFI